MLEQQQNILVQHWPNIVILDQYWANVGPISCISWDAITTYHSFPSLKSTRVCRSPVSSPSGVGVQTKPPHVITPIQSKLASFYSKYMT